MARKAKRAVSLLLVLLMVATCVWSAFTVNAATDVLFKDDFSSSALTGWNTAPTGSVVDGKYVINGSGVSGVTSLGSTSGVAVMADVSVDKTTDATGKIYNSGMSSILFHASENLSSGYEFGLGVSKNGTTYAILYRTIAGTTEVVSRRTTKVPGTQSGKVVAGTEYALKVIMEGNTFSCFINNELFYEYTDNTTTKGFVGVATWNAKGSYDNFTVQKVGKRELLGIRLENTPAEITLSGAFDLDIIAQYAGVFGDKRLNVDSDGVKITGIDGKMGQKTLTVNYGGKSAQFTTNVVASKDGEVLLEDAFDSDANWNFGTGSMNATAVKSEVKGGRLVFNMPAISGFDAPLSILTSLKNVSISDAYYSVSVDATITGDSTSITKRYGTGEIYFANVAGTDYRFRISSDGIARLYAGSTLMAENEYKAAMNKAFRMRVDVRGDSVTCFVDDAQVISYKVDESALKSVIRLAVHNGSVQFDNFKIAKLEKKSKWAAKSIAVIDSDGKSINSYSAYNFDPNALQLKVNYYDGTSAVKTITQDMISGFDASSRKQQTIQVTYGNVSKKLSVIFTDYIYYNDFSDGLKGIIEAKNTYAQGAIRAGMLMVDFTIPEDNRTVNKNFTIPGCSEYGNYAVSADVLMSNGNGRKTQWAGLQLRTGGNGTSYIYRLKYTSADNLGLQLLHSTSSGNVEIARWPNTQLLATFPLDAENPSVTLNTVVNLKIEAIGNALYCYFNNVLLDVVYDAHSEYVYTPGGVSLQAINTSAAFDNIYVTPLGERKITNISVTGEYAKDGVLQLYQGFKVEPDTTGLSVNYSDGLQVTVPLWEDYITQAHDPNLLGQQQMTVSYMGKTDNVQINVVDRPDYVAAFVAKVNGFKKGSLTAADAAAITELIRYFGTLSPYEVQNLGGSVYKDYVDLVKEMDVVKNDTLKDVECAYYNDFSVEEDMSKWSMVSSGGKTFSRNGYLTTEMKRFGVSGSDLFYNEVSYSEIKSIEADVMLLYPSTFVALTVYAHNGNYYHLRLTNKYLDENGQKLYTVQLYKYNGAQIKLAETYPILRGVEVQEGKWNNLRMLMDGGILTAYIDDTVLFQYDDSNSTDYITDGYVAFRTSENDARYDNIKLYGVKKEIPKVEYEKQITPTEYTDDFEDETVGKDPSHWVEDNETDDWKVMNKGGSKVYGTTVKSKPVYSWLHAFEADPVYKAKFLSTAKNSGKVGFITRMYDETGYLGIGYNYAVKKWFFAGTMGVDMDLQTVYAETSTELAAGEWHDIEINLQGETISVLVNGKEVLASKAVNCIGFGRMGVFADGADLYVDEVYVKSVNGTNFNDSVIEYNIDEETYLNSLEVEDLGNGILFACHGSNPFISYDNGQTFEKVTKDSPYYSAIGDSGASYVTYLEIGKGRFLKVIGNLTVYESTDGMKTWKEVGRLPITDEEWYDPISSASLPIFHTSSMTKIEMPNGVTRLFMPVAIRTTNNNGGILGHYSRFFYSDDWGRTWTESENDTRDIIPSYNNNTTLTWAEGKVIKCSDGSIRFYQTRNKNGCTVYLESKDYGVTWTEFGRIPYMQCPMGSFGIEEDPTAPGTYYMAYVNGAGRTFGGTFPRTRLTLVKTTDGKNWEFVTDIERTTDWSAMGTTDCRQFLDPCVCVTEDYVYVTYGRCNQADSTNGGHNNQRARFVRLEKDKLSTRPWDDATMHDSTYVKSIEIETLSQTKFGYGDLFNTVGLEIKLTSMNGMTTIEGPKEYFLVDGEPNMFKLGKQTIKLLSKHYCFTEYEIEIVPNYDLFWEIRGKGTVDPDPDATLRMMEGSSQTFTLKPAKGYTVDYVKINGKEVKVKKNAFTISNVQEDQEIQVVFRKLTLMDYLPWIILGAVVVAGIAVGCILLIPKLKNKSKKAAKEEDIDISSNSTPPADDNQ